MDARTAALHEALTSIGVELLEPLGALAWRGRDADGAVLVRAVRPGSRVRAAALRARADRLAAVRHRGVVDVLGNVVVADHVAVAQRELAGPDLATVLRGRPRWDAGEVRGVVVDLADALAALHADGLVHGDVAPANVVLGPDGRVVLVDLLHGADPDELGTPGWVAPERASGATAAADVWSVAALGLELLGRCPDAATGLRAQLERALADDARQRPGAATLAAAVRADGPVDPVRPVEPSLLAGAMLQEHVSRLDDARTVRRPRPPRGRHRRRGLPRGVAVPLVLGAVLVAGSLTGLRLVHGGAVPSAGSAEASATRALPAAPAVLAPAPDLAAAERAARGLSMRRAAALAGGNLPALLSVAEPGSPAAAADRDRWRPTADGPAELTVTYARAVPADAGEWRVAVGVRAGEVSQDVVLRLVTREGRWLVRAVEAA